MMNQSDFLQRLKEWFEQTQISYMLTGSFGSSIHGEPRATNDIDIVISATQTQLEKFFVLAQQDCYVSVEAANDALRRRTMFNIIDHKTGWKADLIFLKAHPYFAEEFHRRRLFDVFGISMFVVSPEDTILSKLVWMKETESERQFRDAVSVGLVQYHKLDLEYLQKWGIELGITELLSDVLSQVKTLIQSDKSNI
ncbi:MAG: hypothetical protein HYZ34_12005 [Ignavibacteriae bacterium]|nr:hypothetical protein [Ignavibacteriota bacterium]